MNLRFHYLNLEVNFSGLGHSTVLCTLPFGSLNRKLSETRLRGGG